VYQVEHKNHKKSNEMYYPRFTKVIIHYFMSKDPSIPRRNKVNWNYVRDDFLFLTIKMVSRHQNTQQYGAMLPIELTNDKIRNTKAYKQYYAFATREAAPKPNASARRKRSGSDTSITPPIATTTPKPTVAVTPRLTTAAKGKQIAKSLSAPSEPGGSSTDEGTGSKPGVLDVLTDKLEELSWNSFDDEGADDQEKVGDDDEGDEGDESDEGEEDADEDKDGSEDEGDGEEDQGLNIGEEERLNEEEEADELYRDVNINQGRGLQTTQFAGAVSAMLGIIQHFMDQRMNEAVQVVVRLQSDRLREEAQKENDEFLRTVDENIKKIIKEQGKDQVKAQVSKILPRIEQAMNEQLKAKVLTRSSHSSRTSYVVAADLSEIELKKILIEKMEGTKSIQRSDAQRNLYKALVDAYESYKIILDTYGETVTLKKRRDDDEDKDEKPFAIPDWGSKRRREGKEPESESTPLETATRSAGMSTTGSKSQQASVSESAFAEEPVQTTSQMDEPSYPVFETCAYDQPIIQSSQHPEWFSQPWKPLTSNRDWNKTLPAI
nr:hypothetical protein [Tanacetum cinerariifolium]